MLFKLVFVIFEGVFLDSVSEFTVDATSVSPISEGNVKVLITNPSGTLTEGLVKSKHDGTYECLYTPFEQGNLFVIGCSVFNSSLISELFPFTEFMF